MAATRPWEDESSGSPFGPPLDALGPDPAAVAGSHEQAPTTWQPARLPDWSPARPNQQDLRELPPSWDHDPMAAIFKPGQVSGRQQSPSSRTHTTDPSAKSGRGTAGIVLLGSMATVAVGVAAAMTYVVVSGQSSGPEETVVVAATSPPTTTRRTAGPLACAGEQRGTFTIGRGPGDRNSGPGVILGFEYAFYTDRNGDKARSYVVPEADTVGSAPTIQDGIDKYVPLGTTYCAQINQTGPDSYELDLTERRPGGTSAEDLLYTQLITTTVRDGRTMIATIVVRAQ
ncbi:hypothetical protein [Nocardia sp. NPDC060249]|uniref:hypothetical protein n=1 Tax=Nocardia sp. NPDC060249 TaxID=3347082 RepID=UPI003654A69E